MEFKMHTDATGAKQELLLELICRLCLKERENNQPLFGVESQSLIDRINDLTSLKIVHVPKSPASLCLECKTTLDSFESFRDMCLTNDKLFHDTYLETGNQDEMVEILHVSETSEEQECLDISIIERHDEIREEEIHDNQHDMVVEIVEDVGSTANSDEYEVFYLDTAKETELSSDGKQITQLHSTSGDTTGKKLCTVCNKYVNRLAQHQLIHKEVRPFQCEYCSKGFNQLCNLKKHTRLHTKEKPYLCSWCSKGFTNSTELKIHIRSHTQERPFACTECGKSFVTSGHLVRHGRSHSGLKPYECDVCEVKFSTSSHLVRHKRIHSMEQPYGCAACGERFMRTEYLRAHKCKLEGI